MHLTIGPTLIIKVFYINLSASINSMLPHIYKVSYDDYQISSDNYHGVFIITVKRRVNFYHKAMNVYNPGGLLRNMASVMKIGLLKMLQVTKFESIL